MKRLGLGIVLLWIGFGLSGCSEPIEYTIQYETNGGSFDILAVMDDVVESGQIIIEPSIEKHGFDFLGWYSDSTFLVPYDFSKGVEGNLTLHAKWEASSTAVTYHFEDDVIVEDATYGGSLPLTVFSFEAWNTEMGTFIEGLYLDSGYTQPYTSNNVDELDLELYVKKELFVTTISYYGLDGILYQETKNALELVLIPEDYTLEGYIYVGAYFDEDYIQPAFNFLAFDEDKDIYLKFIPEDQVGRELVITFVPNRPTDEILDATDLLDDLMIEYLNNQGHNIESITIEVGSSYEDVAESLVNGTTDIAYLPTQTYVLYADNHPGSIDMILSASRAGLNKDSDNAMDWNDGEPTMMEPATMVPYYRGLILAGPSPAGQVVAAKVNVGQTLLWDDVKDLTWCVRSETSSSGYVYPKLWLYQQFGHTFDDITGSVVVTSGFGNSIAQLATETCDVATVYGDARMHYEMNWTDEYGRFDSIWDETNVIGVTTTIMNDGIAAHNASFDTVLLQDIINFYLQLGDTSEGQDIMDIYSHQAYQIASDEDYDPARLVLDLP